MEAIQFRAGAQVAGTEVIDASGVHWTVLKNIGNATAQPREGAYYTRVLTPIEPPVDYKSIIDGLVKRIEDLEKRPQMASDTFYFNDKDFYYEDYNGKKTIRKR